MTEAPVKRKPGRPKGSTADKSTTAKRPTTFKGRLDQYLKILPRATPNDISLAENLVTMEMEMDRIRKKMSEQEDRDGLETRKLSEALSNHSKEFRLISDSLGIGRNQRSDEIDMQKEIDQLVSDATELVERSGVRITCNVCVSDYEMGMLLFHFKDEVPWKFAFACPKCGSIIVLEGVQAFEPEETSDDGPATAAIEGRFEVSPGPVGGDEADRDRDSIGEPGQISEPGV